MSLFNAVIWGVLQGLTEFIPVSSSGHLVVVPRLIGLDAPGLPFNIALHAGALLAVLIYFRKDITGLFTTDRRLGRYTLFATLPLLVCGALFAEHVDTLFLGSKVVGWIFIANGIILFAAHLRLRRGGRPLKSGVDARSAFIMGLAQALALLPGISRSGITITAGLYAGMERKEAYRFSFLLFVPAVMLAFIYSLSGTSGARGAFGVETLIGMAVSAAVGLAALRVLFRLLERARLYILAIYCIFLGSLTIYNL